MYLLFQRCCDEMEIPVYFASLFANDKHNCIKKEGMLKQCGSEVVGEEEMPE